MPGVPIGKVSVKVLPDTTEFRREAQRKLDAEEKRLSATVQIRAELADDSLKATKAKIDHWQRGASPVDIAVRLDLNDTLRRGTQAKIDVMSRPREVELLPKVNKAAAAKAKATLAALSGSRVLHKFFEDFSEWVGNLDKALPKIASVGLGIMGIGAWGATASANLFALSASLAQIAGVGLALPGIFAGIGVGLGVTLIALKDFKNALPGVYKQYQKVKDQVTKDFWLKAASGIRQLADVYLPHLNDAAKQVGAFWGKLAGELSKPFQAALGPMFANLRHSIAITTKSANVFANIITQLGLSGSQYLPRLARWFVKISTEFSNFLDRTSKSGELSQWVNNGIKALHDLGQTLKGMGSILSGLSRALTNAGGSTLSMFSATVAKVAKVVNSRGFQKGMTQVFKSAFTAMHNIATQAGPAVNRMFKNIGKTVTGMLPRVGTAIGKIGNTIASVLGSKAVNKGIVDFFHGVEDAINRLAPVAKKLGPVIGQALNFLGQFAKQLGGVLAQAVKDAIPLMQSLLDAVTPVMKVLTGALTQVLVGLAPAIKTVGTAFADLINPIAKALGPALNQIVPQLTTLVTTFVNGLAPVLPQIGQMFADLVTQLAPLMATLLDLTNKILKPLMPVIVELVKNHLQQWVDMMTLAADVLTPLLKLLDTFAPLINALFTPLAKVTAAMSGLLNPIKYVKTALRDMWAVIKTIFGAIAGFVSAPLAVVKAALKAAARFAEAVWSGVKGVWSSAWSGIKGALSGIWNGIKSTVESAGHAVANVAGKVWNGVKSLWSSSWNRLTGVIAAGWQAAVQAVRAGISAVVSLIKKLPGEIVHALGDLGGLLFNAGKAVIGGFVHGISSAAGGVKSVLGSITDKLTSWKGPPSTDRRILTGNGVLVIQGFIRGLESQFGSVKSSLGKLTRDIPKWKGPVQTDRNLLLNAGKIIMSGLLRGLESQYSTIKQSLSKLTKALPVLLHANFAHMPYEARLAAKGIAQAAKSTLSAWKQVSDKLDAARQKLSELKSEAKQYYQSIKDAVISTGDVTQIALPTAKGKKTAANNFAAIKKGLTDARDKARSFAATLKKLAKLGLDKTTIDQLAQAGPEAGLAQARAILDAGKKGVEQVNRLQRQLAKAAAATAKTAMDAMYQNGIQTAKGFVNGLKSQKKALKAEFKALAEELVRIVKQELGIHSPSRVFHEIGAFTGLGLLNGLESQYGSVKDSLRRFAKDVSATDFGTPTVALGAEVSAAAAKAGATNTPNSGSSSTTNKTLNYYAPAGSAALSSREQLFRASKRSRFAW